MIHVIRNIKSNFMKRIKKRQFDKGSIYGIGTMFDSTSGCQNGSSISENITIGSGCMIRGLICTSGNGKINIGDHSYIGGATRIGSVNSIIIGNDVIIANDTHIYDNNNHPVSPQKRMEMTQSGDFFGELWKWGMADNKAIVIEDNVWIGERCSILKGVKIGKGAIVGCNSVVTHDVPEYTIVAGNPAKVVKNIPH